MPVYISILRGINVGGARKIPMNDLKIIYENLGFEKVKTYIQSGNLVFTIKNQVSIKILSSEIEKAILNKWNYHVPVILRTLDEMEEIIRGNPFIGEKEIDQEKLHVTLLSDFPEKSIEGDYVPDRFSIVGKNIYLYCPNGYGRTKLSNTFFEKKLKLNATTRNWKSITKLLDIGLDLEKSIS
jgi:uncharacterized protein (DUF1697 family)